MSDILDFIAKQQAQADEALDSQQLQAFRSNPPHFLTVSAKG